MGQGSEPVRFPTVEGSSLSGVRHRLPGTLAHDLNLLRETQLRQLLQEFNHDPDIASEAVDHFQQFRNLVDPYPDVMPALTRLKTQYTLVSVTNGTTEIDKTPLKGVFDHSFNAKQAGHAKPHPAIFERVVEITGSTHALKKKNYATMLKDG